MKVALITLHRVYNYGTVLQAWSTQQVLEDAGHEVSVIDYITPSRTKKAIFLEPAANGNQRGLRKWAYRFFKLFSILLKEMTFGSFVQANLHLTKQYVTAEDLDNDPPKADVYVTGSDQVWNSKYNHGVDRGFFLDFLPEDAHRVAFVASFGATQLSAGEQKEIGRYVGRYQALSVRASSAQKILESLGRPDAVWLIDPTLQIRKETWISMASKRLVKEKYCILMLLYNEDNHATEYARKIANAKGLKLVKVSWEMKKPPMVDRLMTHRSPTDFLSLFYNADFVVTNSFHGLAFSINFEKQFVVVPRNEFNSRIESLLQLTGLEDRMVSSEQDALGAACREIAYKPVREVLERERERATEFIRENIN